MNNALPTIADSLAAGLKTVAYTLPDNSGDGTGVYSGVIPASGTNSCSITVAAGAVITIANSGDHTAFQNLYIWWETA